MQLVIVIAGLSAMSDILQGSVTTPMRFGGTFSVNVTTNSISETVFDEVIGIKRFCAIFGPPCRKFLSFLVSFACFHL